MEPAADSDHLAGALAVVIAIIALAEVARPLRYANVLVGAWLLVAPWWLTGATSASSWNSALAGAAIVLLSLPAGKPREHYGTFDRALGRA